MISYLKSYLPEHAVGFVSALLSKRDVLVEVKNERKSKHGDYRRYPNGTHKITVNSNLNQYRFLITLIHEIAHFDTYNNFGSNVKPHGKEWKYTFQRLMLPFLIPKIFPSELLPVLAHHFKNPKASSDTDTRLSLALKKYDEPNNKLVVLEISEGTVFKIYNGRVFKRGLQRRKRIECTELLTEKKYLFNPNAEVELVNYDINKLNQ